MTDTYTIFIEVKSEVTLIKLLYIKFTSASIYLAAGEKQ